ncbi:MAG: AAA family ATPase [Planctomycetes bacterium]|nr:AAA family ATPase [Planctomycetota bacterium]
MSKTTSAIPRAFTDGSTWVRGDFHLHTRADKEFKCSPDENAYVAAYIAALKRAAIEVGVITNHNKFDRTEFRALQKAARKEEILLLPGVELNVKDGQKGVHTLLVFSDEWYSNPANTNHIESFLTAAFAGQDNVESENSQCNFNIETTIQKLNEFERDYFLVFAHVEYDNGLWGALGGRRIESLGNSEEFRERCLGFQKVSTYDKREKIQSHLGAWYPSEVEGSDCKSIDKIGEGTECFINVGAFTYEAVKFALSDYRSRVSNQRPEFTHSRIRAIGFEGSKLDGKQLHFSPSLNTFIGIRGSGKSSIIESLRYALGIELPENADSDGYKQGSVKNAIGSGGKITVRAVNKHGVEYEVRRILGERPDVYRNGELQPGVNIRKTVLHNPIYFGQKDLSSKGDGFEGDLIERLVGDDLAEIRQSISLQRQAVVETVRRLQKLSSVEDREREYKAKLEDAVHRLQVYKEHKVEERLPRQISFDQDGRAIRTTVGRVENYLRSVGDVLAEHGPELNECPPFESEQNPEFFEEFSAVFDRIIEDFERLTDALDSSKRVLGELKKKAGEFDAKREALKEEFAEVTRTLAEELQSSGHATIDPDEFLRLRKTIENAKQILEALKKEKAQRLDIEGQLDKELTNLNDLWYGEFKLIEGRLNKINAEATALQITIEYKGDKPAFLSYIKALFRGSRIQGPSLKRVTDSFRDGMAICRAIGSAKEHVGGSGPVFEEYFNNNLSAMLTWQVPNRYVIKYHGKQLKKHSLGQRASALILFVLSQRDNDVIIIDQPEDDLDNQTIYEDVIKLVRRLKPTTQFIFATHNPNIPVLGDAQQVIACEYTEDAIRPDAGSIDVPSQQEAIVKIMEGGREAFQRRKEIYQGWKSQNS